jgi:hypothetical protein
MIDLVCLVADKNMEAVVSAVLGRHEALGIRPITRELIVHPQHDSACYHNPTPLLRPYRREASHALVLLDRDWAGVPDKPVEQLEADVGEQLSQLAPDWARGIVIVPEIEVWLFSRSPRLDEALGWRGRRPALSEALATAQLWPESAPKPTDPKRAMEWALQRVQRPRSSSIYGGIAATLGTRDCTDPSFRRFQATLQAWFPPT